MNRHAAPDDDALVPATGARFRFKALSRREKGLVLAVVLLLLFGGGGWAYAAASVTTATVDCDAATSVPNSDGTVTIPMRCRVTVPDGPTPTPSATQTASPSPSATASPSPTVAPTTSTAVPTTPPASPSTSSPTPSPTTTAPAGSWPDASNTGPTGQLALRPCSSAITLGAGAVLQNVAITGGCDINVTGRGVVIRNISMAVANNDGWAIIVRNGASATISDVEIFGLDKTSRSVQYAVLAQADATVTITRADLHHCADCVQGEHVTLTDSWVHDLANIEGVSHVDGFQCNGNCNGTVIRHNRIDMTGLGQTGTVSLFQDFGVPSNVVVEANWLSGGGFTVYGGGGNTSSRKGTPTNIRITNNRIDPGVHGWLTEWNGAGAGNVLSGNYTSAGAAL